MLPWEEHIPQRGKNTEHTMSPESESMRAMEKYDNSETLQQSGAQPFTAQCAPRQTESIKRQGQNGKVKSKKPRSEASPAVTPIRVLHHLASLDVQSEVSIKPDDEPISINLVKQLQEVNNNDQAVMSQFSTMNKMHGNDEMTFIQLTSSQEVTANRLRTMQENTTNHLQLSQVDAVNRIQMNQENTDHQLWSSLPDTDIRMQSVHGYTSDQPSQAETMNHKQTNMENTFNQLQLQSNLADTLYHIDLNQVNTAPELQSNLEDTVLPTQTMQQCTTVRQDTMNHIQMYQENTANQLQSSLADTIVPIHCTQGFSNDHSQPNNAGSMNQIHMMQNNMNNLSHPNQADSLNQIDINLENTTNHLDSNYAENPLLQTGFSWAPEQNGGGGAHVTDFWGSVESSVPMQIDGVPVASFPANVKFQSMAATAAAEPTSQATVPVTVSDQSGLVAPSLFGNVWSDPCIEFAFKTLTGDIPVLDDTAAVTDYFPQQQDLNKSTTPNCSASALDNSKTHTQVDINLPLPRPSDKSFPMAVGSLHSEIAERGEMQ